MKTTSHLDLEMESWVESIKQDIVDGQHTSFGKGSP